MGSSRVEERLADCSAWFPVVFVHAILGWSYYAYVAVFLAAIVGSPVVQVVYGLLYHLLLGFMLWSYWRAILTKPVAPPLHVSRLVAISCAPRHPCWPRPLANSTRHGCSSPSAVSRVSVCPPKQSGRVVTRDRAVHCPSSLVHPRGTPHSMCPSTSFPRTTSRRSWTR